MKPLRASFAPIALACPQSLNAPSVPRRDTHEARLGTAAHAAAADIVRSGRTQTQALAVEHRVDVEELESCVSAIRREWDALAPEATAGSAIHVEQPMSANVDGVQLTGHPDVLILRPDHEAVVVDWKTGWQSDAGEYTAQMAVLAALVFLEYESLTRVTTHLVLLRSRDTIRTAFRSVDVAGLLRRIVESVDGSSDAPYTTGPHCRWCPRLATCPGLAAQTKDAIAGITRFCGDGAPVSASEITRETWLESGPVVGEYRRQARAIRAMLDRFDESVRAGVELHGTLPLGDDRSLVLRATAVRRILPTPAWPILTEELDPQELADAVTVQIGAVCDAVRARAPRGHKWNEEQRVMARLEEAGALETHTQQRLVEAGGVKNESE